jgi:death-on-curing protein
MIEPKWVMNESALSYHEEQLVMHGGGSGIRDMGLLQSAMLRPQNAFHYNQITSLTQLAAAYMFGIAKNHPFVDGNKRTAYIVARAFLILNGFDIKATKEEKYLTVYGLAEGMLTEAELVLWLESKIIKI